MIMTGGTKCEGKHGWRGECCPAADRSGNYWNQGTFSVGVFQWIRGATVALKPTAVKVRVSGSVDAAERVYAKANEIAAALDAGTYAGTKRVTVR